MQPSSAPPHGVHRRGKEGGGKVETGTKGAGVDAAAKISDKEYDVSEEWE